LRGSSPVRPPLDCRSVQWIGVKISPRRCHVSAAQGSQAKQLEACLGPSVFRQFARYRQAFPQAFYGLVVRPHEVAGLTQIEEAVTADDAARLGAWVRQGLGSQPVTQAELAATYPVLLDAVDQAQRRHATLLRLHAPRMRGQKVFALGVKTQ